MTAVGAGGDRPWRRRRSSAARRRRSAARRCRPARAPRWLTAVICGTPTPATMRVVQMEPGPMPTLTASAPASTSAGPPRRWRCCRRSPARREVALIQRTRSSTPWEWPCAVSTTSTSTPASTSAATRSSVPRRPPRRRRRAGARGVAQAFGKSSAFWMSLTVIMPRSSKASLTTSTFSMRCLCSRRCTSSRLGALAHGHQLARAAS
jgi:hypothetical protein